jgi:hypothetical protein
VVLIHQSKNSKIKFIFYPGHPCTCFLSCSSKFCTIFFPIFLPHFLSSFYYHHPHNSHHTMSTFHAQSIHPINESVGRVCVNETVRSSLYIDCEAVGRIYISTRPSGRVIDQRDRQVESVYQRDRQVESIINLIIQSFNFFQFINHSVTFY